MNPLRLPESGRNSSMILVWKYHKRVKMGLRCLKVYIIKQLLCGISLTLSFTRHLRQGNLLCIHCFWDFFFLFKPKILPLLRLLQWKTKFSAHLSNTGPRYTVLFWCLTQPSLTVDTPTGVWAREKGWSVTGSLFFKYFHLA